MEQILCKTPFLCHQLSHFPVRDVSLGSEGMTRGERWYRDVITQSRHGTPMNGGYLNQKCGSIQNRIKEAMHTLWNGVLKNTK